MNKFFKITCRGVIFFLFVVLSTVCTTACMKESTGDDWISDADEIYIDECGKIPWGKLIEQYRYELDKREKPKYVNKKLRFLGKKDCKKFKNKCNLLNALLQSNKTKFCNLKFSTTELRDRHFKSHGESVGAKSVEEYMKKLKDYLKIIVNESSFVNYNFTEDKDGNVGLQASIADSNDDKYLVILGLNEKNALCIKTFYKYVNSHIAKIIDDPNPIELECNDIFTDETNGFAYIKIDGISIKINNLDVKKNAYKEYLNELIKAEIGEKLFFRVSWNNMEINKPIASIVQNKIKENFIDDKTLAGKIVKVYKDKGVLIDYESKVEVFIHKNYLCSQDQKLYDTVLFNITGMNTKGYVGREVQKPV